MKKHKENQTFEDIKHIDENNMEFWYARELMEVLEYKQWRRFENVIKKKTSLHVIMMGREGFEPSYSN